MERIAEPEDADERLRDDATVRPLYLALRDTVKKSTMLIIN